jgi:hypothetical protein
MSKTYFSKKAVESLCRTAILDNCRLTLSKQPLNEEEEEQLVTKWLKKNL